MKKKSTQASRTLFESEAEPSGADASSPTDGESVISEHEIYTAAVNWKMRYTELADLPARFRQPANEKLSRISRRSKIEQRFQEGVRNWVSTINLMIDRLGSGLAWRIVSLRPLVEPRTTQVTQSQDFLDMLAFMALRRDVENCGPEELGCLSGFLHGLQLEIEKQIHME